MVVSFRLQANSVGNWRERGEREGRQSVLPPIKPHCIPNPLIRLPLSISSLNPVLETPPLTIQNLYRLPAHLSTLLVSHTVTWSNPPRPRRPPSLAHTGDPSSPVHAGHRSPHAVVEKTLLPWSDGPGRPNAGRYELGAPGQIGGAPERKGFSVVDCREVAGASLRGL